MKKYDLVIFGATGFTGKLICDYLLNHKETKQIIGIGIVGPNAGDLITEGVLAIEMGCYAEDIALTIHPHPTLTETFSNTAEVMEKTITDLYIK